MEEVNGRGGGVGGAPRLRRKDREPWGPAVSWTDPLSLQFTRCPGEPCGWVKQKSSVGAKSPLRVVEQRRDHFLGSK